VRKFLRLPSSEQRLLITALFLVGGVRSGLSLLPFATVRRITARMMRGRTRRGEEMPLARIVWSVEVTSRYVPRATCLTQAIAAQTLLARRGYRSQLRIGVARDRDGSFIAHAWVEHEGRIVLGQREGQEFTPLPSPGDEGF
jgi:hypothetical protein